jgi:hypothetical protein
VKWLGLTLNGQEVKSKSTESVRMARAEEVLISRNKIAMDIFQDVYYFLGESTNLLQKIEEEKKKKKRLFVGLQSKLWFACPDQAHSFSPWPGPEWADKLQKTLQKL